MCRRHCTPGTSSTMNPYSLKSLIVTSITEPIGMSNGCKVKDKFSNIDDQYQYLGNGDDHYQSKFR